MRTTNFSILENLNSEVSSILLPAVVIVAIYLIIGLFGNPLVVLYYGWHEKSSPSHFFIVAMAIFDLMICCISMPMEIVDMSFAYTFPSRTMCKLFRFVNYFASISSGLILISIAIDRYRKVCQPFKKQFTIKISKIIILGISVFAFCIACFVFHELVTVNTTQPGVVGHECTTNRSEDYKLYILVFNGVCFLIFIACIVSLIVLYVLVGRKLIVLKRFRCYTRATKFKGNIIQPLSTTVSEINLHSVGTNPNVDPTVKVFSMDISVQNTESNLNNQGSIAVLTDTGAKDKDLPQQIDNSQMLEERNPQFSATKRVNTMETKCSNDVKPSTNATKRITNRKSSVAKSENKLHNQYIHLKKYTVLMFTISTAFIISFVPYLGILTWRSLVKEHEGTLFSNNEYVAYNIVIRSWLISSVVNPFIYGFFNTNFRLYVWDIFRRQLCFCIRTNGPDLQKEGSRKQGSS